MTKILVVEDELYIRENLVDLLDSEGFEVFEAVDGSEGLQIAQTKYPDLILSDIRMPKLDGIQFLKKLQSNPDTATIPLVFLSAKVELNEIREGMLSGADDYITKPFKSEDVLNAIEARLKKKKNYQNLIEDLRSTFVKNVPHELRTPLISILGFSELIENDLESIPKEELRDMIQRINKSGKRLHRRIEKLIKLSYLLSDNRKMTEEDLFIEIDPEMCAAIIKKNAVDSGRNEDIEVTFQPAVVKTELNWFESVLEEFLDNSIKFSLPGTPIKITGTINGNYYKVAFEDKGSGIDIKNIEEADLFKKIEMDYENKEGLGLGLAIVKRIMDISKGYVKIKSKKDKFSKIEFGFPLSKKK